MNQAENQPKQKSNWPPKTMGVGILVGVVLFTALVPSLDGATRNFTRILIGCALLSICLLRWGIAHYRKEQSRGWIAYLIIALSSPLICYLVEVVLDAFGKW